MTHFKKTGWLCLTLASGILSGVCLAQAERSAPLQSLPQEVVITGEVPTYQLRDQIENAQARMHDLFNELNGDDRFDISCSTDNLRNSHIGKSLCLPNFYREETRAQGQAYLAEYAAQLGQGAPPAGSVGGSGPPPQAMIARQQKEMQKKIAELANENAEYREAIIQYVELKERYSRSLGNEE